MHVRDLCIVVGDKSAKSEARRSALKEVVEKYFQPGMSVRKLSEILSNFTFLKTGDCEFIRAFAGAWPFDESLLMSGNTMVCFRVRWNDPDSSAVVWFLIGGHQPDDGLLIPLFTGKWPANSKSTLMAVKLGMP